MMPQKEVNEAVHQPVEPDYGRYEGQQTSSARQEYESPFEQNVREEPSGKVYPRSRDTMNILRFVVPAIAALLILLLFAYLFVVVVGGIGGVICFVATCFVICF